MIRPEAPGQAGITGHTLQRNMHANGPGSGGRCHSLQRRPTTQRARFRVWESRPSLLLDGRYDTELRTAMPDAARARLPARPPSVRRELQFEHRHSHRTPRVPGRFELAALGFPPACSHRRGASDAVWRLWHRRPARARAPCVVLPNCYGTGGPGGGDWPPEPGACVPANGPGRARAFVSRSCDGLILPGHAAHTHLWHSTPTSPAARRSRDRQHPIGH